MFFQKIMKQVSFIILFYYNISKVLYFHNKPLPYMYLGNCRLLEKEVLSKKFHDMFQRKIKTSKIKLVRKQYHVILPLIGCCFNKNIAEYAQ